MFTEEQLRGMRDTQESALPDTATVYSRERTSDGFGGFDEGQIVTIAAAVPARFVKSLEVPMFDRIDQDLGQEKWTVRVPVGTPVDDEDFIEWLEEGLTLRVIDARKRSWQTIQTLECERLPARSEMGGIGGIGGVGAGPAFSDGFDDGFDS